MAGSLPSQSFSQRFGVRPSPPVRQSDDVPDSAKVRLVASIVRLRGEYLPGAYSLGPRLCDAMGRKSEGPGDMARIRWLIYSLEWWEYYDISEELLWITGVPEQVANELDTVFVQERLPYRITTSGVEWRLNQPAAEAVSNARSLLNRPEFAGPSQQWEKALGHLSERPPDPENGIKDAVGALEGMARILAAKPSETLGQIIRPLATNLRIHPALANAVSNVYGYRGDEQAIAHGAISALQDLIAEAELLLHWCAAAILYLAKKSGRS